jgi:hypothetical protein
MGFFSLYIIIMSGNYDEDEGANDYDDLYDDDDVDMPELQELPNTEARDEMKEDPMSKAVGDKLYGPTGRGSPKMINISPYELSRNSGKALRNEGIKDDSHLKKTKYWHPKSEQQRKEEAEEKQMDDMLDDMYREMMKPVARSKAKSPSQKKGGTRKRSTRRRRNKRSTRRSRRNKNRRR